MADKFKPGDFVRVKGSAQRMVIGLMNHPRDAPAVPGCYQCVWFVKMVKQTGWFKEELLEPASPGKMDSSLGSVKSATDTAPVC